jgi:hypothetical protein
MLRFRVGRCWRQAIGSPVERHTSRPKGSETGGQAGTEQTQPIVQYGSKYGFTIRTKTKRAYLLGFLT